jgi:ribA/ribD-fused uncharacterized protein
MKHVMSKTIYFSHPKKRGGEFSQAFPCKIQVDGYKYKSADQYVFAQKAKLMGDRATFSKIMNEKNPIKIKSLGRRVRPWNQDKWEKHRFKIILDANTHKFRQNPRLANKLKATGKRTLAQASEKDFILGIGMPIKDAIAGKPWRGMNLLGKVLVKVRKKLQVQKK